MNPGIAVLRRSLAVFVLPVLLLSTSSTVASAATSVTAVSPDGYSCSQPGSIGFEDFADKTDLSAESFPGLEFTTTNGFTWRVGDFSTGLYNGKYPNGAYTSQGTHWAWLGESQGSGRIDLTLDRAKYFSLLVSANTAVTLDAYKDDGTLLESAGPAPITGNTGTMTELRITRTTADIGYVVVHDSGNYFLIDALCSDARGVGLKDTDADGLADDWETQGVDTDDNGTFDLDLPAMGADPNHKDLFVEVDWLTGEGTHVGPFTFGGFDSRPSSASINRVVTSFNGWPVPNPDGVQGIRLHLDAGSDTIMNPKTATKWGSRSHANAIKNGKRVPDWPDNDSWSQLDTFRNENVPKARRGVFHYVLFVDEIGCGDTGCTTGISRGIPGHDLLLAKGDKGIKTDLQEAVTLAHELGHNLGLGHGGRARTDDPSSQDVNKKANYLSIMNYYYSNTGLVTNSGIDGIISYSPQELDTLYTTNLNETSGLSPDPFAHFRAFYKCSSSGKDFAHSDKKWGDTWGAIDWDCDGHKVNGSSNTYLQDPDDVACVRVDNADNCLPADASQVLGSEDYHHLRFWGNGQGWDARNEAMRDFDQPGTAEPTIAAAKADGVWWPSHALVSPVNPEVTVYPGSGVISVPLASLNAGEVAFTIQPRMGASPAAVALAGSGPVSLSPGAMRTIDVRVDTDQLQIGSSNDATVEYINVDDGSVLGATKLTINVANLAGPTTEACAEARAARAAAQLAQEQAPALDAFLAGCTASAQTAGSTAANTGSARPPAKPTACKEPTTRRTINVKLSGKARRAGVSKPKGRLAKQLGNQQKTVYRVKLTRNCVTIAYGTMKGKALSLTAKSTRVTTITKGKKKIKIKIYPRLRGKYVLQSNGGKAKFSAVKVVIK